MSRASLLLLVCLASLLLPALAFHNLALRVEHVTTPDALHRLQALGFSSLKSQALAAAAPASAQNTNIYGNILPLGIYWTSVYLGVPATGPYYVALDTGSTDLMVPGFGCQVCHLITLLRSLY
jgi:hypothetical protein